MGWRRWGIAGYQPLYIKNYQTGLVQSRENFILPEDAYPILENAYVWRERIKRKQAYQLLGRLQRSVEVSYPLIGGALNFIAALTLEPNSAIVPGSINLVGSVDGTTYTDPNGNGVLVATGGTGTGGTINYSSTLMNINIVGGNAGQTMNGTIQYYPNLPVMGIRIREINGAAKDTTIFFDQVYAYIYNGGSNQFQEFIPGTTWSGNDSDFFWSTNYWVSQANAKIFWTTNYSLTDPIRYTDGNAWVDFSPQTTSPTGTNEKLWQALALLPFRGRLLAFNTSEGAAFPGIRFTNRIRWAAIGTPFTVSAGIAVNINPNAWRDDIRGQGGFLDIPTNEDIVAVGFVRDNLVIYCEQSTWQLRYTGRTIAPFQIEKVNSELGSTSTFSAIQFDTSLVGIGDKGIIECDSFKSERIDVKIPDFVFHIQDKNNGQKRIQGIRDFINRLAYWTYPSEQANGIYPDRRLVYNYENDSWSIFTDSLTTLGTFNEPSSRTWINTHIPWIQCNFPWINQPATVPVIVGGNQQGFIEQLDEQTTNDPSLYIQNITGNAPAATVIQSTAHNLQTNQVIKITNIPTGTPFATALNNGVFAVTVIDANNFSLRVFDPITGKFSLPQQSSESGFVGYGLISVRDNFNITSKKFNFLDDGQSIQMGYLDILMDATEASNPGSISMNVFINYNDDDAMNTSPENTIADGTGLQLPDTFFNSVISTSGPNLNTIGGSKFWQRVICPIRGNFITIQFTFNDEEMAGTPQELDVQIDSQVLWLRRAGRLTSF